MSCLSVASHPALSQSILSHRILSCHRVFSIAIHPTTSFSCQYIIPSDRILSHQNHVSSCRGALLQSGDEGKRGSGAAIGSLSESVVGMYVPTAADLALRAAAAGLVASVLGRVKEFTTLFAQVRVRLKLRGFPHGVDSFQ